MAAVAAVQIAGLKQFRKDLKEIEGNWGRELGRFHRDTAKWLAGEAQAEARSMGGQQAHFADAIKGRGTQTAARLEISPEANMAFWGSKPETRAGWNDGWDHGEQHPRQYLGGAAQGPPWVGITWEVGGPEGPYALNDTVHKNVDELVQRLGDGIEALAAQAFPDGARSTTQPTASTVT